MDKNVAALCICPKNSPEAELRSNGQLLWRHTFYDSLILTLSRGAYLALLYKSTVVKKNGAKGNTRTIPLSFQICDREHKVFSVSIATKNESCWMCQ